MNVLPYNMVTLSDDEEDLLDIVSRAPKSTGRIFYSSDYNAADFETLERFDVVQLIKLEYDEEKQARKEAAVITSHGKDYITYRDKERKKDKRFWITTAISVIALIKSFWPEIVSIIK